MENNSIKPQANFLAVIDIYEYLYVFAGDSCTRRGETPGLCLPHALFKASDGQRTGRSRLALIHVPSLEKHPTGTNKGFNEESIEYHS